MKRYLVAVGLAFIALVGSSLGASILISVWSDGPVASFETPVGILRSFIQGVLGVGIFTELLNKFGDNSLLRVFSVILLIFGFLVFSLSTSFYMFAFYKSDFHHGYLSFELICSALSSIASFVPWAITAFPNGLNSSFPSRFNARV